MCHVDRCGKALYHEAGGNDYGPILAYYRISHKMAIRKVRRLWRWNMGVSTENVVYNRFYNRFYKLFSTTLSAQSLGAFVPLNFEGNGPIVVVTLTFLNH